MVSRRRGRRIAVQALYSWEINPVDLGVLLSFDWMSERDAEEADLDFARLLVRGCVERIDDIDEAIRSHLDRWDFSRINKVDLAILRTGVYAIMYQPDVPPQVTIDEAIELSKTLSSDDSYRFINGVLDAVHREKDGN